MPEYIEREALLNEAKKRAQAFSVALIYEAIKEAPACDVVEVVRGEWVEIQKYDIFECSECGYEWYVQGIAKVHPLENSAHYCPNCGAKMDGERRSE